MNINAGLAQAGLSSGITSSNTASKTTQYTKGNANNAALGADEAYFLLTTVSASSNETINLQNFSDVCGENALLARLKCVRIHLLGASETAPDGTAGTACSSVTVGNAGTHPNELFMGGTTQTFTVNNASCLTYQDGSAAGIAVSSTACNVLITNNDSANSAVLLITVIGGST